MGWVREDWPTMTPARKELTSEPAAPARAPRVAPGMHALALRAGIGLVRIVGAGVI